MFHRLGELVARRWLWVILAWVAVLVALRCAVPRWEEVTLDGDLDYLPRKMTSVRGDQLLAEAFPERRARSQIAVVVERADGGLTKADDQSIRELYHALRAEFHDVLPPGLRDPSQVDVGAGSPSASGDKAPAMPDLWAPVALSGNDEGQRALAGQLRSPITADGQAALLVLHLRDEFMATANMPILRRVLKVLDDFRVREGFAKAGLRLGVAGSAAIGSDMLTAAAESIRRTEIATIVLVLAILLLVYRAPLLALIPLVTLFVAATVATDLVAALATAGSRVDWFTFKVFRTTKIFLVVILWGVGTDFCLFLISRYREELGNGLECPAALARASGKVGVALAASALTTIVGLGMMTFADFGKFRYAGPALALGVTVCLLACVTLTPALLRAFGGVVFWPSRAKSRILRRSTVDVGRWMPGGNERLEDRTSNVQPPTSNGAPLITRLWQGLGGAIIARPALILIGSVALLAPLAWHGYAKVEPNYDLLSELSTDRPSAQGTAMMRRHFAPGDTGPLTVIAYHPRADFRAHEDGRNDDQLMMHDLTKYLGTLDYVRRVHSWSAPFGERVRTTSAHRALAEPRFVSQEGRLAGHVTRLTVILASDPFSPQGAAHLADLRGRLAQMAHGDTPPGAAQAPPRGRPLAEAWHGAQFECVGTTAATADLKTVTTRDQTRIQILCVLAVLGVMLVMLRRTAVCVFLIASVVFGFLVTLGTTDLVFRAAYGPEFVGLDWKVPLFLFVILVAVGADYNIYLVTRVFEEQQRLGPLAGLREAVVRTGGIISSCGLITAGAFVALMSGTMRGMLELGFALSLGILLDTFFVRPLLVPAFLALVSRRQLAPRTRTIAAERIEPVTVPPPLGALTPQRQAIGWAAATRQSS